MPLPRLVVTGTLAAAAVLAARRALLVVTVEGTSMLPSYRPGDRLLAVRRRFGRAPRSGDVVVVRVPAARGAGTEVVVKRVRAVGPAGLDVRGDHEPSYDSRLFGPVPLRALLARVVLVVERAGRAGTIEA